MNRIIQKSIIALAAISTIAIVSCNKDTNHMVIPNTPEEITIKSISGDYNVTTCEEFTLKIKKVLRAKSYQWIFDEDVKSKLRISGDTTNKVSIIAKEAFEIPAGAISVIAINGAEKSQPCTLDKPITVTHPLAGDITLRTSSKDVYVALEEEFTLSITPTIIATSYQWSISDEMKAKLEISGETTNTLSVKASESMDIPAKTFSIIVSNEIGSSQPGSFDKVIHVAPPIVGPETITISPDKQVFNNEPFTLTASDVETATGYVWEVDEAIKDILTVSVNGNGKSADFTAKQDCIIPANMISVKAKNAVSMSTATYYDKEIRCKVPYTYKTKIFGTKTWFIENCRESGDDLALGKSIDEFGITVSQYSKITELTPHTGRYYTWYEMMTGISGCTEAQRAEFIAAKNGKDDMGNSFALDGTANEYNVQLRGCCPEGWHIPNCNDWWDLFATIEEEYCDVREAGSVANKDGEGFSFVNTGYPHYSTPIAPVTKDQFYSASVALMISNVGNLGAYLRGGTKEEGFWIYSQEAYGWPNNDHMHSVYYTPKKNGPVEFDWYPCSYVKYDGTFTTGDLGKQGIFWLGFTEGANNRVAKAFRIKCDGHQFTQVVTGDATFNAKSGRVNVRCVKNY